MRQAPLLLFAGTAAGFIGVLGLHLRQAPAPAPGPGPSGGASSGAPAVSSAASGRMPAGPAGPGAVRTALGPEEQFGYGVLDVKVTQSGTRITDVSIPLLQTAEPTSQQISEQAITLLRGEVLSAQGTRIDAISGATYTSAAYIQSLQAAIDKLHSR
jgi:Na+-translocating ferredoxin:NAD+ oxidoreductase RnfG subunit